VVVLWRLSSGDADENKLLNDGMILSDPPQTWLDWLGVMKGLRATQVPIKKKRREIWGVAKKDIWYRWYHKPSQGLISRPEDIALFTWATFQLWNNVFLSQHFSVSISISEHNNWCCMPWKFAATYKAALRSRRKYREEVVPCGVVFLHHTDHRHNLSWSP
jgi:hypothetical protein